MKLRATSLFATAVVFAGILTPAPSAARAQQPITGTPGVVQYIGTGPIDRGPRREGITQPRPTDQETEDRKTLQADVEHRLARINRQQPEEESETATRTRSVQEEELKVRRSGPELLRSFDGLTHRDSRLAGGNLSGEPPDQGLCLGGAYVLESVNTALRVFDRHGKPLTKPIALTAFYGYPPLYDPATATFGPAEIFDISCYYDADTQRWFHVALTMSMDPDTGFWTGPNRLDIAVSRGPNPLGDWNYYAIPTQNDGTEGTPDHRCAGGPCFGDFPHIGADKNGFYITTNSFPLFKPGFSGANLYAISKAHLATGHPRPVMVSFDRLENPTGGKAFRIWPALSEDGDDPAAYFVSDELRHKENLIIWTLTDSVSLKSSEPRALLWSFGLPVSTYHPTARPAKQRDGDIPLADCLNDTSTPTPLGRGCWRYFLAEEPQHDSTLTRPDPGFTMYQVYSANGLLWATQLAAVDMAGERNAGIAWYVIKPQPGRNSFGARLVNEGRIGVPNHDLAHPAIAATKTGQGVIYFSLIGDDHYPSAAYVPIDKSGVGDVRIAAEGLGPIDGFTGYPALVGPYIQRYGDYSAAVADGDTIWAATEYIGQTCTLEEYLMDTKASPLASCHKTRTSLANWYTRISQIKPGALLK